MTIAEDLTRIEELRNRGSLTDDEFNRAKARILGSPTPAGLNVTALNGFRRSTTDRWVGGLCGGLGAATGMASWLWRLLFTLLFLVGGTGLLIYIIFWVFVPSE